jgi:flavin reductase (DIM6/NTAB) family NADH-FMN oxidoreductase RutF
VTAFAEPEPGVGPGPDHLERPDDHLALRDTFATFPSGVATVAAQVDGEPIGLIVSSFVTVSLDPPLVSVCIDHGSTTWPRLRQAERIGVSVLANAHERTARQFAGPAIGRFTDIEVRVIESGAVLIDEAAGWFECSIYDEVPAGDHDVVLLRVHGHRRGVATEPLVFHRSRFRGLVSDD